MYTLRKLALVSSLLPFCCLPVYAATFTSGAYDSNVHLTAGSAVAADAQVGAVAGTAAPAYNLSGGAASIGQTFTLTSGAQGTAKEGLQAGLVTSAASSDGATGATGTATLANAASGLSNQLLTDLFPSSVLSVGASAIGSTTTVGLTGGADPGGILLTGTTDLAGLTVGGTALGALSIDGSLFSHPDANTLLLSLAGLKIILNEQIKTGDSTGMFMQTNAIHIALNNYSLAGKLLSGDIILGHSEAGVSGVPEPASWAMMLVGFGMIGAAARRRRPSLTYA